MSEAQLQMFATVQAIATALVDLVKISTPILLILGNFGEISSVIVFFQRTFRTNPCAIYLLAASCTRLIFINFNMVMTYLSTVYGIDLGKTSLVLCKIQYYVAAVTTILPSSFVVLACLDRYLLSSRSARVRAWSTPSFAYRSIAGVSVFWMVFSIHTLIGITILPGPTGPFCYIQPGAYTIFTTLYSIIISYSLPPALMSIFGLLTIANVRQIQRQVHPSAGGGYTQRKERYVLHMLLFQVLMNITFTIPPGIYQIYRAVTDNWQKDLVWLTWDLFFFMLAIVLFYIPNCIGFYIYTLTAGIFRREFIRIVTQCYRHCCPQRQMRVTTVWTASS